MKIDLHTHILPRDWPDLDKKYGYGGFIRLDHYKPCCARMMVGDRLFREISDNVWDPKRRIEDMERTRVSMQVLSTVPVMFGYWAKPADGLDLSRRLNDHIAGVVRDHPKQFTGLGTIPMQDPDLAAGELERCVRELGLVVGRQGGEPLLLRVDAAHARGLKVITEKGWFTARPSGTENIYKIYAESFRGADHLRRILEEAQTIVGDALAAPALHRKAPVEALGKTP